MLFFNVNSKIKDDYKIFNGTIIIKFSCIIIIIMDNTTTIVIIILFVIFLMCVSLSGSVGLYTLMQEPEPEPNAEWELGEWSKCANNTQSRTVTCPFDKICPKDKPKVIQDCLGEWEFKNGICENSKFSRVVSCPDNNDCPVRDYNGKKYTKIYTETIDYPNQSQCIGKWVISDWSECKDGKKEKTATCPLDLVCDEKFLPKTLEENCNAQWEYDKWGKCKNDKQTRQVTCKKGHKCPPIGTEKNTSNPFTQETKCIDRPVSCPSYGCLPRGKIKDVGGSGNCVESTSYGIKATTCSSNEKQMFDYDKSTQMFKTYDNKCLVINNSNVLTTDTCDDTNYAQKFNQDGDYIYNLKDGFYLHKEWNSDWIKTSETKNAKIAYTNQGVWEEEDWGKCIDNKQKRRVICDGGRCDKNRGHTDTFEEERNCSEVGNLTNSGDYRGAFCVEQTNSTKGVKMGNCYPARNEINFTYYPPTELIKANNGKCLQVNNDNYKQIVLANCNESNDAQKFKYNDSRFVYTSKNGKFIQNTANAWPSESTIDRTQESNFKGNIAYLLRLT